MIVILSEGEARRCATLKLSSQGVPFGHRLPAEDGCATLFGMTMNLYARAS